MKHNFQSIHYCRVKLEKKSNIKKIINDLIQLKSTCKIRDLGNEIEIT
jgi:hypothetical protein